MRRILTRKQTMVLDLILRGRRNQQIARTLEISEKGVKYHKTNIFKLYGVGDTEALIKKYVEIQARHLG